MDFSVQKTFRIFVDGKEWYVPPERLTEVDDKWFVCLRGYDQRVAKLVWTESFGKMPSYLNLASTAGWQSLLEKRVMASCASSSVREHLFRDDPSGKKRRADKVNVGLPISVDLEPGVKVEMLTAMCSDAYLSVWVEDVGKVVQHIRDKGMSSDDGGAQRKKRARIEADKDD